MTLNDSSCMVTCHRYSMFYMSPAITIPNTETPLPSLLVTSWRRVGHPKMHTLFGRDVTLPPYFNIQTPNEGNTSWPSDNESVNRNRRTPKTPLLPPIVFKTLTESPSYTLNRPQTSNFGPAARAGPSVPSAGN